MVEIIPRGMTRDAAAAYLSLPVTRFVKEVREGRLPKPWFTGGKTRQVWDRAALDRALDERMSRIQASANDGYDPLIEALM